MRKRALLAITALLLTLGIAGIVWSFAIDSTPRPVAIIKQTQIAPSQDIAEK